jgi:hypothetical protein
MAGEDVLAGIAGGIRGGIDSWSWRQKYEQDDRAIDQRKEIADLRAQVQLMIAQVNGDTRRDVVGAQQAGATERNTANIGSREKIAGEAEAGRNTRWMNPSGNATLSANTSMRNTDANNALRRYGIDTTDVTARRGQDIGATTTRRGQDIGAATATRGQDLTFGTNLMEEGGRNSRNTESAASRERAAAMRGVTFSPYGQPPVTPTPAPVGSLPITTRPATPAPAANPNIQAQAATLMQQFDAETDPTRKRALQQQMQAILEQLRAPAR